MSWTDTPVLTSAFTRRSIETDLSAPSIFATRGWLDRTIFATSTWLSPAPSRVSRNAHSSLSSSLSAPRRASVSAR